MANLVGIIGFGKMGEAIISGCLNKEIISKDALVVVETNPQTRQKVALEYELFTTSDLADIVNCAVIILAVRPNDIGTVCEKMTPILASKGKDPLILSVAAGVQTKTIEHMTGGSGRIVRIMPNTSVLVGSGMTVLCGGSRTTREDLNFARKWFSWLGYAFEIEEEMFDVVAAMSGSGPAYFYYFIDKMIKQGVEEGLDHSVAKKLAIEAAYGAVEMLKATDDDPIDLLNDVAVPGGSTNEVISHLREKNAGSALMDGIAKAIARNEEMGHQLEESSSGTD